MVLQRQGRWSFPVRLAYALPKRQGTAISADTVRQGGGPPNRPILPCRRQ